MRPAGRRRRWALAAGVLACAVAPVVVPAPAAAQRLPRLPGPCDLPLVGALCDVPDAIGGAVDAVAGLPGEVADAAVEAFASWVANGAASFVATAGTAIFSGTQPDLTGADEGRRAWFLERYADMALVSLGLFVPLLILAVLHGVLTGSPGLLWRAVANLPVAALGTAAAVVVVQALLGATDAAAAFVARSLQADTGNALSGVVGALTQPAVVGGAGASLFGAVLLALFMAAVAFVVWLELVVREAAVYLTVAFLPLGFATDIWPALSSWLRRLIEVIVALVLSKLVIVVALSMAGSALAAQEGFAALVAGAGMLLLAAFAPFALFKLIPVASMATMSSLEGQGRRAVRASTPRMSSVFYARQLTGVGRGRSGAAAGAGAGAGGGPAAASSGTAAKTGAAAAGPAAPAVAAAASGARVAGGAVRRAPGVATPAGGGAGGPGSGGSVPGRAAPGRSVPPPAPDAAKPAAPAPPPFDVNGEGPS